MAEEILDKVRDLVEAPIVRFPPLPRLQLLSFATFPELTPSLGLSRASPRRAPQHGAAGRRRHCRFPRRLYHAGHCPHALGGAGRHSTRVRGRGATVAFLQSEARAVASEQERRGSLRGEGGS